MQNTSKLPKVFTIPGRIYERRNPYLIVFFVAMTLAAIGLITNVTFDPGYGSIVPPDDPYLERVRDAERTFGNPELITVAVDVGEALDSGDIDRIYSVTNEAARVGGVASATSVTNVTDLFLEDDVLVERTVFRRGQANHEQAIRRIEQTPLFRKLFISRDGEASFVFIVPETGTHPVETAEKLIRELSAEDITLSGDPVIHRHALDLVGSELTTLGLLALAVVLAIEIAITRSVRDGAILALVSAVPAVWTLALFPLFGQPISISSAGTPVIVLLLATSYTVHVYRRASATDFHMSRALDGVTETVAVAGATTIAGFLSLAASPGEFLRTIGVYVALGTVAALLCALGLLPRLLGRWSRATPGTRGAPQARVRIPRALYAPRRPWLRAALLVLVVIASAAGVPSIRSRASYRDAFASDHTISRSVAYFSERTGTDNELSLIVETEEEYGLVDLETYRAIRKLQSELEEPPTSGYSIAYTDVVEWFLGRMEGSVEPREPASETDIGEALELLAGQEGPFGIDAMTSIDWETARILTWVKMAGRVDPAAVLDAIDAAATRLLPGAQTHAVGLPRLHIRRTEYLMRSQGISLGLFFGFLTLLLLVRFRSLRWTLIAALPTVAGVAVYFGLMGWLGALHDPTHVVMMCALLGVSNDDVLYFLIAYRRETGRDGLARTFAHTGVPIVQTTTILAVGLSVFYFSSVRYFSEAGALLTVGLLVATATTLFVIPGILRRWDDRRPARAE